MKRRKILLFLLLITAGMLFATGELVPRTLYLSSPVYDEMDILYRLQGLPLPSGSRPWSSYEVLSMLDQIPSDTENKTLYEHIGSELDKPTLKTVKSDFSYLLKADFAAEAYGHTNSEQFKVADDWIYGYDERRPLARFSFGFAYGNRFYTETSIDIGSGWLMDDDNGNGDELGYYSGVGATTGSIQYQTSAKVFKLPLSTNMGFYDMDYPVSDWPRQSQISFGGPWWHLTTGRTRVQWGNGMSGNLAVGSHINHHQNLTASFFNEYAKVQFLYLILPDPLQADDQRIFMGHRLEARLHPKVRLSVTENIMYKGTFSELRYFDPNYVFHNLYDRDKLNALASLELSIALLPGLSLHSQFVLDQFQLPNESASEANAAGYLAQLAYSWRSKHGYWTAATEYVQTEPSLYRRDEVDFIVLRGVHNTTEPVIVDYLGYQWGPDSQVIQTKLSYLYPGLLSITGSATIHRYGEITYDYSNPDPTVWGPSPSGDKITERLILGLEASYQMPWKRMMLYSQINWIGEHKHTRSTNTNSDQRGDLQVVLGTRVSF